MGRIRTSEIKTASFNLLRAYPDKFTVDFERNKSALDELKVVIDSKHTKNQLAGYIARIARRKAVVS